MSQEQVEAVIQAPIKKMDVPSTRRTHLYRDGSVDLMLVFDGDRLVRSQIIKTKPLFGLEETPAVYHCS